MSLCFFLCVDGGGVVVWVGGLFVSVLWWIFFEDWVLGLKRGCCCVVGELFSKSVE